MDAQRFGRALGQGTRAAAKALLEAADAAAAPTPAAPAPPQTRPGAGRSVARGVIQARATAAGVQRGSKRFGEAMWGPAARAGGVLWYEVTGFFFGLFALTAGVELWRERAGFLAPAHASRAFWSALVMVVVFGWFTVSSFLKAHRHGKRRP